MTYNSNKSQTTYGLVVGCRLTKIYQVCGILYLEKQIDSILKSWQKHLFHARYAGRKDGITIVSQKAEKINKSFI